MIMRNKLFASAQGGIGLSWLIAVLLSFSTIIGVTNMLVAQEKDTMQDTRCWIQDTRTSGIVDRVSQCDSKSEIQNLSSSSIGDPQLDKAAFTQKTKKLQIPFIANEGQVDKSVKFYANTFGGTVFVTKDGEIVYALPNNSSEVETQCLASSMHSPNGRHNAEARIQDNSESCIVDCASVENRASDIVHSASCIADQDSKSEFQNPKSGIALREEFVGSRIKTIHGEDPSVTNVNYFKGNNPEKWKNNISTYDFVNLGEIYKGIELKLKAYGDNVEKLFCVKPGASPETIRIQLNGAKLLKVNEDGQLIAETELGPVKFTKPVAYQEIAGKRVEVRVEYRIQHVGLVPNPPPTPASGGQPPVPLMEGDEGGGFASVCAWHADRALNPFYTYCKLSTSHSQLTYGFTVASYDRTKDLIIDPLLASTYLGGSADDGSPNSYYSITLDTSGNVYVTGSTGSTDFPVTSGAYDTSLNGSFDVFVSKLDGGLTTLLASTYLGGSGTDGDFSGSSSALILDTNGNVYVTGSTGSTDFPVTSGAYATSLNGSYDVFVSKLNSGLTSLLASTYLGGSSYKEEAGYSLAIDTSGNVYVTGLTYSSDFPTTSGAYDTSKNSSSSFRDAFVSKLNSGLTSLLASTYLGGSSYDMGTAIAIDTGGNVYVTGSTQSTNFPTTSGAYDTSYNGGNADVFISKLDGGLTSLLASTYLGGSSHEEAIGPFALDSSGNVYVAGYTYSSGFPTTSGAYDTSFNGGDADVFISKLDSGLTSLLASTFLGGSGNEDGSSLALDTSGNVYVTGYTNSTNFPTTSGAYDTSSNGSSDVFVSKLNSGLASLLASTYLGGSSPDVGTSLARDSSGNVYVTGLTNSTNFPTTSGAYDTSYNGGSYHADVFVSKLDSNLSASSKPTVTTGTATNVTSSSATLNGTVNANGLSTSAWFNYGITSGSYNGTSTTQSVSGSSDTTVSIGISGLSSSTTYYYRIAASSSAGTSYGSEASFTTSSAPTPTPTPTPTDTTAPSGSVSINSGASYTNSTTVTLSLSATDSVGVVGYYASTSSSTPTASASGWNSVTSTTSYSGSVSYTLASGDENKTVYVWYKDSAGNVSSAASDSITLDTTAPIITITSPTSNDTYTATSSALTLEGSASDTTSGVKEVTWSNDKGGSGTASGTTYWSISSVSLSSGDNKITVTAKDNAGNTSTDTITVTYNAGKVPTVTTGSATNITENSATLNGTVNANGLTTTAWFSYGTNSGSYTHTSSTQTISGSSDTAIGISISGLTAGTKYYYTLAAQNSAGTSTGSAVSFTTKTASATPTPTTSPTPTLPPLPTPAPTLPPLPTPQVSPSPIQEGIVFGFVNDQDEQPLKGVTITITGKNSSDSTETDENGYYEFTGLSKGDYTLIYEKEGFLAQTQDVSLNEGEVKDLGTVTMEQVVSGKIYGNVVNIKGDPIEFVRLKLKGIKTKVIKTASSDADGFFEFTDLESDTYVIVAKKKKYRNAQQKVTLEEGASEEIEIEMKKTSKRVKGLLLEEEVQ